MFKTNKYQMHSIGILVCLVVIVSANSVHGQLAQPYQYAPQQYQNAFNQDYRRYNAPYSGYSAASSSPYGSGSIVFPDDTNLNTRHKKDMNRLENRHNEHTPMADEESYVPLNITTGIESYEDFYSMLDEDSRKQLAVILPRSGVERSAGRMATPASCVPEMTVVPLKLADGSDQRDPTILVFPPCTRVKRCGGCCTNNLLSCQPMETNNLIFEVYKSQYQGGKMKLLNKELVEVEEHTRCKCDCRLKPNDCSKFQRYNKAQCMCICINIEDKNKCLAESSEKIWDAKSCTCRCRESKECSTGTYFDENSCSCQETPGHRHTQQVADRRRLITKPVIYVPETPETYYDSGT